MWRNNIYEQSINESDIKLSSLSDLVRGENMQPCADAGAESQKLFLCYVIELIKMPQYYSTKYYNTKAREKYLIIFSFFFPSPTVSACCTLSHYHLCMFLCVVTLRMCARRVCSSPDHLSHPRDSWHFAAEQRPPPPLCSGAARKTSSSS